MRSIVFVFGCFFLVVGAWYVSGQLDKQRPVKLDVRSASALRAIPLPDRTGTVEIRLVTGPKYTGWYLPRNTEEALYKAVNDCRDAETLKQRALALLKAIPEMDVRDVQIIKHPLPGQGRLAGGEHSSPALFQAHLIGGFRRGNVGGKSRLPVATLTRGGKHGYLF